MQAVGRLKEGSVLLELEQWEVQLEALEQQGQV